MIILTTFKMPESYRQLNAIRSWRFAFPDAAVYIFYTRDDCVGSRSPSGIRSLWQYEKVFGFPLRDDQCTVQGTPLLSSMFEIGRVLLRDDERALMWVNSDIVIAPGAWEALRPALDFTEPFFMTGQRLDVEVDRFLLDRELQDDSFMTEMAESGHLLPPCGADWFYFDRRLFHDLPPFAIGRCTFDNALIHAAVQRDVPLRHNMTQFVRALHQVHPESDASRTGPEAQENVRLMEEWFPEWTPRRGWVNELSEVTRIEA